MANVNGIIKIDQIDEVESILLEARSAIDTLLKQIEEHDEFGVDSAEDMAVKAMEAIRAAEAYKGVTLLPPSAAEEKMAEVISIINKHEEEHAGFIAYCRENAE